MAGRINRNNHFGSNRMHQQKRDFFFVACDQPRGRFNVRQKQDIKKHVMLDHLAKQNAVDSVQTSPLLPADNRLLLSLDSRIDDPYDVLTDINTTHLESAARWFFYSDLPADRQGSWSVAALENFGASFWDMTRHSALAVNLLSLMVVHKKKRLLGPDASLEREHLILKHKIISRLQDEIADPHGRGNGTTAVVVAGLAVFALREGPSEYSSITAHLQAIARMFGQASLTPAEWLHCVSTDLLLASMFQRAPYLPYWCPDAWYSAEADPKAYSEGSEAFLYADITLHQLPTSPHLQAEDWHGIIAKLHAAQIISATRKTISSAPLALLYELGYTLFTRQEAVKNDSPVVQAALLAAELTFWTASRWWLPIHAAVFCRLLLRLKQLYEDNPNLHQNWPTGSRPTLLWLLFSASCVASTYRPQQRPFFIERLRETSNDAQIRNRQTFSRLLCQWPLPRDTAMKDIGKLWVATRRGQWVKLSDDDGEQLGEKKGMVRRRPFIAIFEWHVDEDSLL